MSQKSVKKCHKRCPKNSVSKKCPKNGWKWLKVDENIPGATCISDAVFLSFKLYYIIWLMKTMVSLQLWLQNPCVTPWYVFYDFEEWELQDVVQPYAGAKTAAVLEAAKQYGQWPLIHLNKSLDIVKCFLRNWLTHSSDISEALATNLSTKLNLTHVSDIRMSSQHKRRRGVFIIF